MAYTCKLCNVCFCSKSICSCNFNLEQSMRAERLVKQFSLVGTRINKFIEQVRLNKTDEEIKEALENYQGEELEIFVPEVKEVPKPINYMCEYGSKNAMGPWDTCTICGEARFYQNGQKCKEKKTLIS